MIKRTIFIQNPCLLKFANNQLVVSYQHIKGYENRADKTVPIEDIGLLLLEHQQITITHFLLDKLASNNVAVVTCNETHHPTGLLMPLESNTLQSERFKYQINATEPLKKQMWQQTIKAKIANQSAVFKEFGINNKFLQNIINNVKSGDTDNCEATASAHYWKNLFPSSWQFFRKREGPPPNNLLNYGYAIIRASMARAIVAAGLLPTLGIFHRNRYNAYCLADDLMEPYRPFVDLIVRNIINETSNVQVLTQVFKTKLLNVLSADVYLANKEKSPLFVAMQKTATSVCDCFSNDVRKINYPTIQP